MDAHSDVRSHVRPDIRSNVRSEETEHLRKVLLLCQQELAALRAEQETWAEELSAVRLQRAKARKRAVRLALKVRELETARAGGRGELRRRLAEGRVGLTWRRLRGRHA